MPSPSRRRLFAAATALVLLLTGAAAAPAMAAPNGTGVVASGESWTVERAPGGYLVTLRLAEPLPVVSDAPTIVVDGEPVGLARTSDGGRTLTVTTTDPRVATARDVEKGWASSPGPKAGEEGDDRSSARRAPAPDDDGLQRQLDALDAPAPIADPAAPGPYAVSEAEYDFGDHAVALAGYDGVRGEMTGKLYLSSSEGRHPVVVLQHGRHVTCGDPATDESTLEWSCPPGSMVVRSYLGYEGTARALASHGYDVVSVSANGINATDGDLPLDQGAQARGRLVLDTLDMLDRLDRGDAVTFADEPDGQDAVTRTFDEAVVRASTRADQPAPASGLRAADLAGRFDLDHVGLMGHSRGGEGVVTAAQLNAAASHRYGIRAVLPLAPTDFARRTLPDAATAVVLPYCDGDVADQQGQKYVDDSRRAFDDDVPRSAVWVMGANHNFFSSVWTPGEYPVGTSDDWPESDDSSACATTDPTRLTAAEQYQVGVSYMTGFFRLTLGGEEQFRPLFDGSRGASTTATPFADVRVMTTQPRSDTRLVADFGGDTGELVAEGPVEVGTCFGAGPAVTGPPCTYRGEAQVPHWSEAWLAPQVPPLRATTFSWTVAAGRQASSAEGRLRVLVPEGQRDVRPFARLTVKMAPMDAVTAGTDVGITLVDGSGGSFTTTAAALDPHAVHRLPAGFFLLDKMVLQQVTLPLDQVSGVDLADVREVRFTPGAGVDGDVSGGVLLSDLAFDSPSSGDPEAVSRPGVNMAPTRVDEGAEPWDAAVAVWLDRASDIPVTASVNTLVSPWVESPAGAGSTPVTFAPGQTCVSTPVFIRGDQEPSGVPTATVPTSVTTTGMGVSGAGDFSTLTVREDDEPALPPFGVQGDVCAELAASRVPGDLQVSDAAPRRGDTVRFTATGYRAGEGVTATVGGVALPVVIAGADGTAVIETTLAADAALGATDVRAAGAGSARVQQATLTVGPAGSTPTPTPSVTPTPTSTPVSTATPVPAAGGASSPLARTGQDAAPLLAAALGGAVLLGLGVVLAVRRRRRP